VSWLKQKPKKRLLGSSKLIWMRNEINLLKEKLDKEKTKEKHFKKKKKLFKHHNQMIDTNNNQLNRNNMFLLEKMRNMDEQINWALVYARRICHNICQVEGMSTNINKAWLRLMLFLGT